MSEFKARMFGGGGQEVDEAREKAESDRTRRWTRSVGSCVWFLLATDCREQHRRAKLETLRRQGEAGLARTVQILYSVQSSLSRLVEEAHLRERLSDWIGWASERLSTRYLQGPPWPVNVLQWAQ